MLDKSHRLPAQQIPLVLRNGKRVHHELFQIVYAKGEENISRFAFIVSTKIDKRATRRNRMRRVLSECVRHLLPEIPKTFDYVFVVKKNFSDMEQKSVEPIVGTMIL
jgi:ribonuclease P protein component